MSDPTAPKVPVINFGGIGPYILLSLALYLGYDHFVAVKPDGYAPGLAVAAKHSKVTFSPDLLAIGTKLKNGTITTKAELVAALADHSRAFMTAIDELVQVEASTGKITNASTVGDAFDQAGKATK